MENSPEQAQEKYVDQAAELMLEKARFELETKNMYQALINSPEMRSYQNVLRDLKNSKTFPATQQLEVKGQKVMIKMENWGDHFQVSAYFPETPEQTFDFPAWLKKLNQNETI